MQVPVYKERAHFHVAEADSSFALFSESDTDRFGRHSTQISAYLMNKCH